MWSKETKGGALQFHMYRAVKAFLVFLFVNKCKCKAKVTLDLLQLQGPKNQFKTIKSSCLRSVCGILETNSSRKLPTSSQMSTHHRTAQHQTYLFLVTRLSLSNRSLYTEDEPLLVKCICWTSCTAGADVRTSHVNWKRPMETPCTNGDDLHQE